MLALGPAVANSAAHAKTLRAGYLFPLEAILAVNRNMDNSDFAGPDS
jgi:hypothetical protein